MNSQQPEELSMRDRLRARREARRQQAGSSPYFLHAAAVVVDFDPAQLQAAVPTTNDLAPPPDAAAALADQSMVLVKDGVSRWTLRLEARRSALRDLGGREAMVAALNAAAAPDTVEQRVYASLIRGAWDWVQWDSKEKLAAALQSTQWLGGILKELPEEEEVRRRLGRAQFLAPFEDLAGRDFVGREKEIQQLNDFVGITELSSTGENIRRGLRGVVLKQKLGPLVLYGPGGVGKSSLMARFILMQESASLAFGKFPIVYLDFDNSTLQLGAPDTLCVEAVRQLALQFPGKEEVYRSVRAAYEGQTAAVYLSYASRDQPVVRKIQESLEGAGIEVFHRGDAWNAESQRKIGECSVFIPVISQDSLRSEMARREWSLADRTSFLLPVVIDDTQADQPLIPSEFKTRPWAALPGGRTSPEFIAQVKQLARSNQKPMAAESMDPAERFQSGVSFFERWLPRFDENQPLLMVFDTFEEVIARNRLAVSQIFHLIERLQKLHPSLRPVIAGRALDATFGNDLEKAFGKVEVGEFDIPSATAFLIRKGVSDRELAQTIAKQVGGTPLSLKLAAEVLARGEAADVRAGLKDLQTRSWLLFSANETVIQGQLYQRILAHVRNPELRKLAHPGLVLRRVTPGLISGVLADPCGLSLPTEIEPRMEAALRLFDQLRQEAFLVEPRGVNALRHRADVRRVMLSLLEKDRKDQVMAIHRGAVAYYERNGKTGEERAEEIYHRLKLGEDPAEVARQRWMNEAGPFLEDAIPELSPRAQAMIASYAGLKLKDESVYGQATVEEWELFTDRRVSEGITTNQDPQKLLAMLRERADRSVKSPLYMAEARIYRYMKDLDRAAVALRAGADAMASQGDKRLLLAHITELADISIRANRPQEAWRAWIDAAKLAIELDDRPAAYAALGNCAWLAKTQGRADWDAEAQAILAGAFERMNVADWSSPQMRRWIHAGLVWVGPQHPGLMMRAFENGLLELDPPVRQVLIDVIREVPSNSKLMMQIANLFDTNEDSNARGS